MYSEKKKQKVIDYLHKMASITNACKKAGVSRRVFYDWKKADPEFAAEVEQIMNEEFPDFVEDALKRQIQQGDTKAIIFALKCKCRDRGWVERTEQQIDLTSGGQPIRYADIMPHKNDPDTETT